MSSTGVSVRGFGKMLRIFAEYTRVLSFHDGGELLAKILSEMTEEEFESVARMSQASDLQAFLETKLLKS